MNLKPPLIIASGPGGNGEYLKFINPEYVGAYTLKTITYNPKDGNKPPRMRDNENFVINSIGLENPGIKHFVENIEKYVLNTKTILSLGGDSKEEYIKVAEIISPYAKYFEAIEFNFSCPNVKKGGLSIITDKSDWEEILKRVRKILPNTFLIAKLSIEGHFVEISSQTVAKNAWDGLTLINCVRGLMFEDGKIITGGISGPLLKPISLRAIYEVRKRLRDIYIIASGGIYSKEDAKEFLNIGANAISIGSALFKDPQIVEEIGKYLKGVEK
ncbi:dihydroorotate dehydrogenase [Thermosipho melanesiensis]|uniref:Dihydroorotate dehydrogenase family protein n=2 Tax=Thermosipho melanesiensis TaxID=46541 RepID=A6LJP0_THEM4|nr:tRNA-dihydrouridine synthase [Thermosipho melanesiensis]ABR30141.1 dihydroorotate dehydrogenase family protein [Thermosipho melanesiensis BI429]APT73338.1 dihydroorotate dehydrogenase [Thermosipho melanesiensis]OOC38726.1 dihydroorotate dehydrogenase [Thermosipho melanesiensis]OOC40531.1 dihydroorotate dehydrogenase [Thermosipho melanesiensis]OOC40795.1 dihydroorotate dehydrogenase [Thermosipho melanesiensis]